jgi:chorismate synthase
MKIVIAGPKGAGKTTVGKALSNLTALEAVETDDLIEQEYEKKTGQKKTCRQIYIEHGNEYFRQVEQHVTAQTFDIDWKLLITGGSTMLSHQNRIPLRNNAIVIYLKPTPEIAWQRAAKNGTPPWLKGPDGKEKFYAQLRQRNEVIEPYADIVVDSSQDSPQLIAQNIRDLLTQELSVRSTAANTYGQIIKVTTFGESHGPAIGAVLDGIRPGLEFDLEQLQIQMNRRRPGQSDVTTPRSEKDRIHVLSGVFQNKTTGAPIAMVVYNKDQDSSKYEGIKDLFRPGHADFTYYKKYRIRDHRGGGRSSGRETASRVMAGALAKQIIEKKGVKIIAHAIEIAGVKASKCDYSLIEKNPVRCADNHAAKLMEQKIIQAKEDNDSVGGIIKLEILNLPPGLGDPVFDKLDARITRAIMTLGAVKAIEIGAGFDLTKMKGSQSNDQISSKGFLSNNAGGISGGISTGQPVEIKIGVKPTASIARPQKTIDLDNNERIIETHGRHDPCIIPRVIPVIENMSALALLDAWHVQQKLNPDWPDPY